jgi:hypothetical protein
MSTRASYWIAGLLGLLVVVGLPLAGHWARRPPERRCALDGGPLEPHYRVRVVDAEGSACEFCCIRCAEIWLGRQRQPPQAVYVTDEASGQEVEVASAYFVRSLVVTTPTTGNRIHAFRHRADAEKHAAAFGGRVLQGPERPFAARE